MTEQRFPAGWDEQRVQRLLAELDAQSETGACGMAGQAEKR